MFLLFAGKSKVREATLVFDPDTIYGGRAGSHQCLLITAMDKTNFIWKSKGWRNSIITGASMLPRSEMVKVEKPLKGFVADAKLTPVQELKQAIV